MNLNERFNILAQAIELGQKGGILTLDDAVKAKQSIDCSKHTMDVFCFFNV